MAKELTDWSKAIKPLLKLYKGRKHPLEYENIYQLMIMVILSAQDSDKNINGLAPELFKAYPDLKSLAKASPEDLTRYVGKVRNFPRKVEWIIKIAQQLKDDRNIPLTMEGLTALSGIGRKSANVIMREAGVPVEGLMVDLHVLRVAPRLGIAKGTDPVKIEKQIMEVIPQKDWADTGMGLSYLGRETCRPTNPKHAECVMNTVCEFYKEEMKGKKK